MIRETYGNTSILRWDNAAELAGTITYERSHNRAYWEEQKLRYRSGQDRWLGFYNYDSLKHAIEHGWPEAMRKTEKFTVKLPRIKGIVRRKKRADFGDEVDIQAIYSGDLDTAWTTFERVQTEKLGSDNITVLVNLSTSCNVDAGNAFWKGAAACVLVDNLVRMGKSVEVIAFDMGHTVCRGYNNINLVPVKDFEYPMDREHMHAILSPGFHRGFLFKAIIKSADMWGKDVASNLGFPETPDKKLLNHIFPNRRVIVVPMNIESSSACEYYLKSTVTSLLIGEDEDG